MFPSNRGRVGSEATGKRPRARPDLLDSKFRQRARLDLPDDLRLPGKNAPESLALVGGPRRRQNRLRCRNSARNHEISSTLPRFSGHIKDWQLF